MSDSLWPHGRQHARLPCPQPSPRVCSDSCPLSQWCHPTISSSVTPSPPAFSLSQHQDLFQWVGSSHQMAKVLGLQPQHQSFQQIFRVISFRIDWFDHLAVQGTLKSLLQHRSSKAPVLQCSAFCLLGRVMIYICFLSTVWSWTSFFFFSIYDFLFIFSQAKNWIWIPYIRMDSISMDN